MKPRATVLLVNPFIEDFAAYDHFSKPLGLLWLASYLKEKFQVYFINALSRVNPALTGIKFNPDGTGHFHKTKIQKPGLLKDIPRYFKRYGLPEDIFLSELKALPEAPEYVFVTSGMTYWYTGVSYTIYLIREVFPKAKIILGGIYASLLPAHAAENSGADVVVPHQGLAQSLSEIEKITGTELPRGLLQPSYDLLNEYYYAPLMTSVGCVFNCSYCASRSLSVFREFPAQWSYSQIEDLYTHYGVRNFAFYDDALLVNAAERLNVLLENLLKKGIQAKFYTPNGLHIRFLSEKTARLMKEAGFQDLRLSLESSDPAFQCSEGAKADNAEFENAIKLLYRAGFEKRNIRVYTLINVPGQNSLTVGKTMEYIISRGAQPMLAMYSPIPGTSDFSKAQSITDVTEPLFQNNTVYLYRSGFDQDYLAELKKIEISQKEKR